MGKRTDLGLRVFAALLMLAGAGMLVGGITSTIPFAAIAAGIALTVGLAQKPRSNR